MAHRMSPWFSYLDPNEEAERFNDNDYEDEDGDEDEGVVEDEPYLPECRIFKAVAWGDIEELRRLLAEDEEALLYINHFDEIELQTALMRAVERADVEAVTALVETGKATIILDDDCLQLARNGQNALHMAAKAAVVDIKVNKDILKLLLNYCPLGEWYQMDIHGESALHIAARERGLSALSILIDAGFCMYLPDNGGQTAFELACRQGEEYVVWLFFLLSYEVPSISEHLFRRVVEANHWRIACLIIGFGFKLEQDTFWECLGNLLKQPKALLLILGLFPHMLQDFLSSSKSLVHDTKGLESLRELARPKQTPMMLIDTIVIQSLAAISRDNYYLYCLPEPESLLMSKLYEQLGGKDKIPPKIEQQMVCTWRDLLQMAKDQWPEIWHTLVWFARCHRLEEDLVMHLNPEAWVSTES